MNYEKIYKDLILKAKARTFTEFTERHHIIPKSLGGSDNNDNLIHLTPREHYLAHLLLTKLFPNEPKLAFALWFMSQKNSSTTLSRKYNVTSRQYEYSRILFYKARQGYCHSEETKLKMKGRRLPSLLKSEVQKKLVEKENQEGVPRSLRLKSNLPFWTDGLTEVRSVDRPGPNWYRGRITKGKKWWNNGEESKMCVSSPGPGWGEGRIYRRKL